MGKDSAAELERTRARDNPEGAGAAHPAGKSRGGRDHLVGGVQRRAKPNFGARFSAGKSSVLYLRIRLTSERSVCDCFPMPKTGAEKNFPAAAEREDFEPHQRADQWPFLYRKSPAKYPIRSEKDAKGYITVPPQRCPCVNRTRKIK